MRHSQNEIGFIPNSGPIHDHKGRIGFGLSCKHNNSRKPQW